MVATAEMAVHQVEVEGVAEITTPAALVAQVELLLLGSNESQPRVKIFLSWQAFMEALVLPTPAQTAML